MHKQRIKIGWLVSSTGSHTGFMLGLLELRLLLFRRLNSNICYTM